MKFVYDNAAVVVSVAGENRLVIGDLHIGAERALIMKGIRVYNAVDAMIFKIKELCTEFKAVGIIILGDVKDTVLYPDMIETKELKNFFKELRDYDITITAGNHDPHLNEITDCKIVEELCIGDYAFMHGHRWPSDDAMKANFIFAGHNHVAVSIRDKNMGFYNQKAWLVSKVNPKIALKRYPQLNKKARLVVLPAFNDLIIGMPVNESIDKNLSPLFRNKIFDYKGAEVYSLRGERLGTPATLKS